MLYFSGVTPGDVSRPRLRVGEIFTTQGVDCHDSIGPDKKCTDGAQIGMWSSLCGPHKLPELFINLKINVRVSYIVQLDNSKCLIQLLNFA